MQNRSYPLVHADLSVIKENILATLAYFDMFNYPLTRAEIYLFLKSKHDYELFEDALKCLLDGGSIHQFDKFYTLKNDQYLIVRRNDGNKRAADLIKVAEKVGNLLIRCPFVRGIAISGSLSKNFADEESDVDLFIITEKNRLWVARTIMHCFKKLAFLVHKEHLFCMNYYIDMEGLEIPEKNIYTAIEVGTLIPLQGDVIFEKFYAANVWTREFLPNKNMRISSAMPVKESWVKRVLENLLNLMPVNYMDNFLENITASRWRKKTTLKKMNSHGIVMAILTGKHFAKPDPKNFQGMLLTKYNNKVAQLLNDQETNLAH
ncbi:nucleotidyltransferase domain-containing protein [Mucilaginibacter sp. X4EP1]|uniref:nucleotidyltransferase domain-containing protein n=1 Tax=Mucilaginibacter sp. X4EP1 TaxID=2723092 RepID=UPI002166F4B8|nr:nucleotidyltransferase domain-containing protein [Mucilaginibacter sp. X4EP1]MCS3814079.1 putative nucleotidyltransferase [Mucilaginibacter sp. X4EP1]